MRLGESDPRELGPYRLLGRLGSSTTGTVYLGRGAPHRGARRVRAAVRQLRPELLRDRQQRARIRHVTEVMSREAPSPFVAAAHGCELDDARPWVAFEFVPGLPPADLVHRYGPLPEKAVRVLGGALCRGLDALHRTGVVHGDLTPGNVLLAADRPRIVDQGLATARATTAHGDTPQPADDVLALGVLLAHLSTGRQPYAAPLTHHASPELHDLPQGLRSAVLACLHKAPESRPVPGPLAHALDPDEEARHPAETWLPEPWLHDITEFARTTRSLGGRGLFRR